MDTFKSVEIVLIIVDGPSDSKSSFFSRCWYTTTDNSWKAHSNLFVEVLET